MSKREERRFFIHGHQIVKADKKDVVLHIDLVDPNGVRVVDISHRDFSCLYIYCNSDIFRADFDTLTIYDAFPFQLLDWDYPLSTPYCSGRFREVDRKNMPGSYELQVPRYLMEIEEKYFAIILIDISFVATVVVCKV